MTEQKHRILFVCMGNICRSPTAEGLLISKVSAENVSHKFEIDSCGTHDYHLGHSPDSRTQEAAALRGINLSDLRSRKIKLSDFEYYDLILVMDKLNEMRESVKNMEANNKEKSMAYVENLVKLCDLYYHNIFIKASGGI